MGQPDYDNLLNLTFEIEGLLMLWRERGENTPAEVEPMLRNKVASLNAAIGCMETSDLKNGSISVDNDLADNVTNDNELPTISELSIGNEPEKESSSTADSVSHDIEIKSNADQPATMRLDEKLAMAGARDIRRAFTVNDRFRFRRELFSNSESRLADALDIISAMSSLDEAEDYFYNDLCWDRESNDVKDFMTIVANHFGSDGR